MDTSTLYQHLIVYFTEVFTWLQHSR